MVQRVLAYRLQFVLRLMARLRAVVMVAALARPRTLGPLRLALGHGAIVWGMSVIEGGRGSVCPLCRKRFGYALLRHDGSIERDALGGDDVRAQRAGGGRVDEARVARVLDAMYDGGLAVVGIGQRGFALETAVGARVAAGHKTGGLRARRKHA